jgi:hypothetical protein
MFINPLIVDLHEILLKGHLQLLSVLLDRVHKCLGAL